MPKRSAVRGESEPPPKRLCSTDAPADLYAASGSEAGERRGDRIFKHEFVKGLLKKAQQAVEKTLAAQPLDDQWIICVRTYGRAGNPTPTSDVWPKRHGLAGRGVAGFTLAALETALGSETAHKRCLIFCSHEDPDYRTGRLEAVFRGTSWEHCLVVGVKGADFQCRFIEEAAPKGAHVVIADDNIRKFHAADQPTSKLGGNRMIKACDGKSELASLISRAGQMFDLHGARLWSINASFNCMNLFQAKQAVERRMSKAGVQREETDFSKKLGLIYGAFFGIKVAHDAQFYTRYGQVKDDVERTLRYWHADKVILRFILYGVEKTHRPGKFNVKKGGISLNSSEEKHAAEITKACSSLIDEFASAYARLPREGERAPCGLFFTTKDSFISHAGPWMNAKKKPDADEKQDAAEAEAAEALAKPKPGKREAKSKAAAKAKVATAKVAAKAKVVAKAKVMAKAKAKAAKVNAIAQAKASAKAAAKAKGTRGKAAKAKVSAGAKAPGAHSEESKAQEAGKQAGVATARGDRERPRWKALVFQSEHEAP